MAVETGVMAVAHLLQEKRRPTDQPAPGKLAEAEG